VATLIGVALFNPFQRVFERWDHAVLGWIVALRFGWLNWVMLALVAVTSRWTIRILRWVTIAALVAVRRWRHLVVFLGCMLFLEIVASFLAEAMARPRPFGVTRLTGWTGYSMPSQPLAGLAVTLVGMAYSLVVPGRPRFIAKVGIAVTLGLCVVARCYAGVDHPTSAVFGAILGVAIGIAIFRWFAPTDVFPVTYRRGKAAHLDVTGARGVAISRAVQDQLGLTVVNVKPVGLEGSGGSTPLRLTVAGGDSKPDRYVFAKLYAQSHVRADRWYKLGRTIRYGALEDETPFQTVRRFVEYEDYTLRLMDDLDLPTPLPYGFVEITPEREYLIAMEFFDGAVELGEATVDDSIIDQGLRLVRKLWDAGLAHRDIKPANLMVQDGSLRLIDVFFVQVRPSPWRQAVDLANMMLVLALGSDPDRVYQAALKYFTPDEIAEAFAATRGVASPSQLRAQLKLDERDLIGRFRELAPARAPVSIQRWSLRRIALTIVVTIAAVVAFALVMQNWAVFA
jgi:tRNA A-37 threonylcarbamoyl transferase component Bud32/membrane-associated phospholipid phosphatase